jgi:hypothetical protein
VLHAEQAEAHAELQAEHGAVTAEKQQEMEAAAVGHAEAVAVMQREAEAAAVAHAEALERERAETQLALETLEQERSQLATARQRASFAMPFCTKHDLCTETGSGQP